MSASKFLESEVRIAHSLNRNEELFVDKRRKDVLPNLAKLGIHCSQDKVPNIALLGSGGGQRAMVGLLGSLDQLDGAGLLDCFLYLSGISGSTWCMASLYQEADWSTKLQTVKNNIVRRISGPPVSWSDAYTKMKKYYSGKDNFSLTDVWAVLAVTTFVKEIDERPITDQQENHNKDPFPIFTVIDKQCKQGGDGDPWFEVSPRETGYSLIGAFVKTPSFGSQFENSSKVKPQPEMDMLYLQGLCGSAIADGQEMRKFLWEKIREFFSHLMPKMVGELQSDPEFSPASKCSEVLMELVDMNICALNGQDTTAFDQSIRLKLKELSGGKRQLFFPVENLNLPYKGLIMDWYTMDVCNYLKSLQFDWSIAIKRDVLDSMCALYNSYQSNTRDYEDAGLLLNSPYFTVLRKERNVDLIISLDFSEGDPFMTVTEAAKMCMKQDIPFPKVKIPKEDIKTPQDFYVFKGHKTPTVIHMPLFNVVNCGDKLEEWRKKYATFQRAYSPQMITDLMNVAGKNISNNRERLKQEISAIIGNQLLSPHDYLQPIKKKLRSFGHTNIGVAAESLDFTRLTKDSEVRIAHSLNHDEELFVDQRRKDVLQNLAKLGMHCSQDKVPNIALLGSGGGQRAMVGFLGSLDQLDRAGLLDCFLYLSGISGSTWCMASLYQEPDWSTKLQTVKDKIVSRLSGPPVTWSDAYAKMKKYYKLKDHFSLTDVWAVMVVTTFVKEIDERPITDQQEHHNKDPFPIFTVVDKQCKQGGDGDPWFEVSPRETGYSLIGAFVKTPSFGSQFENSSKVKPQPEMDMLYLQGLCGSALADGLEILKFIWTKIKEFFRRLQSIMVEDMHKEPNPPPIDKCCDVLMDLVDLNICVLNDQDPTTLDETIRKKLEELSEGKSEFIFQDETLNHLNMNLYTLDFCTYVSSLQIEWKSWADDIWMILKIFKCVARWMWGRNFNFLHNMTDPAVPTPILKSDTRDYMDAGLLLNSPYLTVLRKERNVDLIISLDFSEGDPFMTVREAAEMCRKRNIPFPQVNIPEEDIKKPKDFYVFKDHKTPTVIHMPLFNVVNCGDELEEWRKKYVTFQRAYSAQMITDLMNKAGENISNNSERLKEEIREIIDKK